VDRRSRRRIVIYILIEHQSKPERLTPLSLLDYITQIYRSQERRWGRKHRSLARLSLQPVLPVVFYTGLRPWESPGELADLVAMADRFARFIPALEPLFVSLRDLSPEALESRGGFFGRVLRLLQERRAPARAFRLLLARAVELLARAVEHLE
jgi:hypothetical protein